jgi:hypothetical protein
MFYRPGGSGKRINAQQDTVYVDFIGGATGWMPINKGDNISVNIARASLTFQTPAQSLITPSPVAPEASVLMELKVFGGDKDSAARPIDQWQNLVVATSRGAHRAGWVRLRVLNINNGDGTGVVMDLQISRTGESGKVL